MLINSEIGFNFLILGLLFYSLNKINLNVIRRAISYFQRMGVKTS